ncbi:hypothetical protein DH2020_001476 [Rehmannia glutinosa]|uniref:Uncharacterized protein n=1 Tax=Rehmannia glutinosa TaxID=99300 RepID=A0ABR0XZH7_REHGL
MDATLVLPCKSLFRPPQINRRVTMLNPRRRSPFILSVLADNNLTEASPSHESKTVYKDGWFATIALNHVSKALQTATGVTSNKSGFDGLIDTTTMVYSQFTPIQQRQLLLETLEKAFPKRIRDVASFSLPS